MSGSSRQNWFREIWCETGAFKSDAPSRNLVTGPVIVVAPYRRIDPRRPNLHVNDYRNLRSPCHNKLRSIFRHEYQPSEQDGAIHWKILMDQIPQIPREIENKELQRLIEFLNVWIRQSSI